ncbi:translation initiation factor IF-3 [Candidatus Roizmanbacteria bacterium RIFCSPHIGHO2_01_FULL_39_12c]|uniref:Translation initiation factor IF-3 n=1 Tax=Candidatus Roizmanbacteria bacterium RIFCSPHIGHO2_01_FULL_39_12c TaxID=1802031 RepID=A0A1F7G832_9BACT|nr:MAG: translation initiation factor IF-3 [Candidatus Roizmanbacteria bacterium RIFCSPHIGHO2_01_FULL_39_12c]OGK46305.1 MAG: translation initiation factor IF-3 [Candidatus Roizmanbacteria bacterium RIFCSPLOWO2_01_FULL_40_13]
MINHRINHPQLRVIDAEGKQIGILSRFEALKQAQDQEVDLVLIAPNASPPVAKIIDLKKFLYQEGKRIKEAKKGIKKSIVKDIKLSLFIAPADFDRLINKTRNFLNDGNQVRINLVFHGREIVKRSMGFDLVNKFLQTLEDINISKEPRLMGRIISTVVSRKK